MSVPYWAVRGAKVVCVDAGLRAGNWFNDAPVVGAVYTIQRAFVRHGRVTLHLAELRRSRLAVLQWGADVGYHINRFRPVIDKDDETEARIFRAKHHTTPAIPEGV